MSLLDSSFTTFVTVEKTTARDGYGAFKPTWQDGDEFQAAVVKDNSVEARVAAVQGVTAFYTVTTRKDVELKYHDVIKRVTDEKIFRVTSDSLDKQTPTTAALDMRQVTAEEWSLPDE